MTPAPQLPSAPDIPLHDIKPLVVVPDQSFMMFIGLLVVGVLLAAGIGYLLWRFWKQRNHVNLRKEAFEALQMVEWDDAKRAAYTITRLGQIFADDSTRVREAYDALVSRLAPYKYRKRVDAIDEETRSYYDIFVEMIDV